MQKLFEIEIRKFGVSPGKMLLLTIVLIVLPAAALAQANGSYKVSHKFNFTPQGNVVSGQWRYNVFTSARLPIDRCGPMSGSMAMPVTNGKDCASNATGAQSQAHSGIVTNNFAVGNVSGTIDVNGFAKVTAVNAEAFSAARSGVTVRGGTQMRNGQIKWGPAQSAQVSGQATAGIHDPISFDVFDPDLGIHTTGTLLDIEAFLGGGSFSWTGDMFDLNATYFDFTLQMNSAFTTQQGIIDFHVRNGLVTGSTASGMFTGILPGIGSSGNFSVPFTNDITLDYDLGNMGGPNADVSFLFDGGGDASAGTPEPSSVALFGSGLVSLATWLRKRWLKRS